MLRQMLRRIFHHIQRKHVSSEGPEELPNSDVPEKLPEHIRGDLSGAKLRELGYSFFSPDRNYYIAEPNEDGVVYVSSFCEDDGWDEDGFGREYYYDHWLMDERLEPIPGVKCFKCMSSQDMQSHEAEWKAEMENAARILKSKAEVKNGFWGKRNHI